MVWRNWYAGPVQMWLTMDGRILLDVGGSRHLTVRWGE